MHPIQNGGHLWRVLIRTYFFYFWVIWWLYEIVRVKTKCPEKKFHQKNEPFKIYALSKFTSRLTLKFAFFVVFFSFEFIFFTLKCDYWVIWQFLQTTRSLAMFVRSYRSLRSLGSLAPQSSAWLYLLESLWLCWIGLILVQIFEAGHDFIIVSYRYPWFCLISSFHVMWES